MSKSGDNSLSKHETLTLSLVFNAIISGVIKLLSSHKS